MPLWYRFLPIVPSAFLKKYILYSKGTILRWVGRSSDRVRRGSDRVQRGSDRVQRGSDRVRRSSYKVSSVHLLTVSFRLNAAKLQRSWFLHFLKG